MTPAAIDWAPLALSARVAALATMAVLVVGAPLAYVLARGRFPGKGLLGGLALLPLVLPPTVVGYALLLMLGRRSPLGGGLANLTGWSPVYHWSGAVIASATAALPLFVLPARAAFEAIDRRLEDAARLLGRSDLAVLATITLPLAWRGLAAGVVLAFARALGDYGATLMLAGDIPGETRTAPLAIYDAALNRGDAATALALSAAVSVVSVAALVLTQGRRG